MIASIILGVLAFLLVYIGLRLTGYGIRLYNNLVSLKNDCLASKAAISLLMKQRHDELPKLVGCCSQYMGHEAKVLIEVAQARGGIQNAKSAAAVNQSEQQLHTALGALFATVEAYPNLKADSSFQNLEARISMLERDISDKRMGYNSEVNLYNTRIAQFPDRLLASRYAFQPMELLEFTDADTTDVNVKEEFKA